MNKRKSIYFSLLLAVALLTANSCSDKKNTSKTKRTPQSSDSLYTWQRALSVYDYDPVQALRIIDLALDVGNLNEMKADLNRATIYSQTLEGRKLEAMKGWTDGARLDSARNIGERLLQYDSVKVNPALRQDVLEILVCTARQQRDTLRWLQRSRQLVEACREQGAETEALRTEGEIGAVYCYMGRYELGMAKLDSVIALLDNGQRSFNELDALIIASKRIISVLTAENKPVETIPLARRIIERLDDYEQHPDDYHDGSYREPKDSVRRMDYIRFYRTKAQGCITAAYASLGSNGTLLETFEQIERSIRETASREHLARYRAMEQQYETEQQKLRADRIRCRSFYFLFAFFLAFATLIWYRRQKRIISRKNHYLAEQIAENMGYRDKYEQLNRQFRQHLQQNQVTASAEPQAVAQQDLSSLTDEQLFDHISSVIVAEKLFLDPSCDRQMLIERFQISKERIGTIFAKCSEAKNISAYINALRLDHASRLLTNEPDLDIHQVAEACGYSSHKYFSTCFKQHFGLSPTDYREARRM